MYETDLDRTIVGWTYQGETLCRLCAAQLAEDVVTENCYTDTPDEPQTMTEAELRQLWAHHNGVEDLPKGFSDTVPGKDCDHCGGSVFLNYTRYIGIG